MALGLFSRTFGRRVLPWGLAVGAGSGVTYYLTGPDSAFDKAHTIAEAVNRSLDVVQEVRERKQIADTARAEKKAEKEEKMEIARQAKEAKKAEKVERAERAREEKETRKAAKEEAKRLKRNPELEIETAS